MAGRRSSKKTSLPPPSTPTGLSIKEYEASKEWKAKSKKLLDDKDYTCEICGRKRWMKYKRKAGWKRLYRGAIHHKHYRTMGHESREDFMTLCSLCHTTFHNLLRYRHIAEVYTRLAQIVEEYFFYEGGVK